MSRSCETRYCEDEVVMSNWIRKCSSYQPTELTITSYNNLLLVTHNTCCSIHAGGGGALVDVYQTVCTRPARCTCTDIVGNHILPDRQTDRQTKRSDGVKQGRNDLVSFSALWRGKAWSILSYDDVSVYLGRWVGSDLPSKERISHTRSLL